MERPIWECRAYDLGDEQKNLEAYKKELEKYVDYLDSKNDSVLSSISERYLLVEWIDNNPCIDGSLYFDNKDSLLRHYETLPKIDLVKHTICTIRNAH